MRTFLQAAQASGRASPALPSGRELRDEQGGSLAGPKAPLRQVFQLSPQGLRPSGGLAPKSGKEEVSLVPRGPVSKYAFPG